MTRKRRNAENKWVSVWDDDLKRVQREVSETIKPHRWRDPAKEKGVLSVKNLHVCEDCGLEVNVPIGSNPDWVARSKGYTCCVGSAVKLTMES